MIKIDNVEVFGWEAAIRGMRNPLNSWDKGDTTYCYNYGNDCEGCPALDWEDVCSVFTEGNITAPVIVGENDLKLMKTLSKAGNDHGKFLRMINVTLDITAPLYWWKEFDTYKVGTVANSCSTMHKIHSKEFKIEDFSCEYLMSSDDVECEFYGKEEDGEIYLPYYKIKTISPLENLKQIVDTLNFFRNRYLVTATKPMKDESKRQELMKKYWWQMIQLLPSSYNQKRTVQLNYQVLKAMYFARKNHKLAEWRKFCEWVENLPHAKELICNE